VPQARSGGSGSRSSAKTTSGRGQAKRTSAGASSGGTGATRSGASSSRGSKATSGGRSTSGARSTSASTKASASATAADPRLEAAAQRLRKLNERIIEAGKEAGETTLSSYEKALKAIASAVERGPGSSDIDWISNLATTQAKFIRDVTTAWTSAARDMLK
jgi:hypothetical protein